MDPKKKAISQSESILHIHGDKCQSVTLRPSRQDGQEAGEEHKRIVGRSDLWLAAPLEAMLSVSVAEGMKVREKGETERWPPH